MFTVGIDGSDLREVIPYGSSVSHFDWRNDKEIIATFNLNSGGRRHYHFVDGVNDYKRLGNGSLDFDGHCTFSPDQKWIATDLKVKETLMQSIILYNFETDTTKTLATFSMKERKFITGQLRCDFHPRWNRDGTAICFDALDAEGKRVQIKARTIFDDSKTGQRIGQIKSNQAWDSVVLVLLNDDYEPFEIYEAEREELMELIDKPSQSQKKRGALSVARFKIISALRWTKEDGLEE